MSCGLVPASSFHFPPNRKSQISTLLGSHIRQQPLNFLPLPDVSMSMTHERFITRYHQGIRIDSIPANGFAGLLFTIATLVIFLGIPVVREFLLIALIGAIPLSAIIYFWHNQTRW